MHVARFCKAPAAMIHLQLIGLLFAASLGRVAGASPDDSVEHGQIRVGEALENGHTVDDGASRRLNNKCEEGQGTLIIDITTDNYGFENSWTLYMQSSDGRPRKVESGPPPDTNYGKNQKYVGRYCLSPGQYRFVIKDKYRDGMCCISGKGSYAGYLDNKRIFASPSGDNLSEDWEKRGHEFAVTQPFPGGSKILPSRAEEWLDSHNSRRRAWHRQYGETYVALQWSESLAAESKAWAQNLAEQCKLKHDFSISYGENLALDWSWGNEMKPTDNILARWVENELEDYKDYPGHLTQVLWRATKYVGCADASASQGGRKICRAQVCRYARPGNCNMGQYKSNSEEWWTKPVMLDDSPCGKECPSDGCK